MALIDSDSAALPRRKNLPVTEKMTALKFNLNSQGPSNIGIGTWMMERGTRTASDQKCGAGTGKASETFCFFP